MPPLDGTPFCAGIFSGSRSMTDTPEDGGWATAKTLAEALPFIQIYDRETVVIKYGGHAMGEEDVARLFAADAVLLKLLGLHPVIVHGGGPPRSRPVEGGRGGGAPPVPRRPRAPHPPRPPPGARPGPGPADLAHAEAGRGGVDLHRR